MPSDIGRSGWIWALIGHAGGPALAHLKDDRQGEDHGHDEVSLDPHAAIGRAAVKGQAEIERAALEVGALHSEHGQNFARVLVAFGVDPQEARKAAVSWVRDVATPALIPDGLDDDYEREVSASLAHAYLEGLMVGAKLVQQGLLDNPTVEGT